MILKNRRMYFVWSIVFAFIAIAVVVPSAYAEAISFEQKTEYGTAPTPRSMVAGDFDGDGALDIATANFVFSNSVSLLLNNGDGTFGTVTNFAVPSPSSITAGDLNGDGILDLVTADDTANKVSVLLGQGDGTFATARHFAVSGPGSIAVGDFNGDSILDLVTTNTSSDFGALPNSIAVLLGNGDGTFNAARYFATANPPGRVITGDLNSDGKLDLVTADAFSGHVSVFLGNGDGTFGAVTYFPTNGTPLFIAVGDLNSDGVFDLVAANGYSGSIAVLLGHSDGSFGSATNFLVGTSTGYVAISDLDSDNILDLVATHCEPGGPSCGVSTLLGNGDGTFEFSADFVAGYTPGFVTIGDFNKDGVSDVAVANQTFINGSFGAVAVLLNSTPVSSLTLHTIGNRIVSAGQTLQFAVSVTNPNGGNVTYSASNLPAGATFDPVTHMFSWTPNINDVGLHQNISFTVSNDGVPMESDSETIAITVRNVNHAPVITPIGNHAIDENQQLSFVVSATDVDQGNTITLSASDLPVGASFNSQTGTFTWTPTFDQAGIYTMTLTATDNGSPVANANETITITVNNINRAPVIQPVSDMSVDENSLLQFTVTATDPDAGDTVTLSANNLPAGASFDPQTGVFTWTPGYDDAGVYSGIEFLATDNGNPILSDSETITITVNDVPPLELTTIADSFLRQGQANRNEGANPHLFVQSTGHNRALSAFDGSAIANYVAAHGISSAKFILTIASNGNNWGTTGRTIDAHPLLETFAEGNGKDAGLPGAQSTRGTGPGVTWNCATDTAIQDTNADCSPEWDGGTFGTPTASSVSIINGQTGEMEWDVTQDVLNGAFGWLVKKTNEAQNGAVEYYSREGAADAGSVVFMPRLVLIP